MYVCIDYLNKILQECSQANTFEYAAEYMQSLIIESMVEDKDVLPDSPYPRLINDICTYLQQLKYVVVVYYY